MESTTTRRVQYHRDATFLTAQLENLDAFPRRIHGIISDLFYDDNHDLLLMLPAWQDNGMAEEYESANERNEIDEAAAVECINLSKVFIEKYGAPCYLDAIAIHLDVCHDSDISGRPIGSMTEISL